MGMNPLYRRYKEEDLKKIFYEVMLSTYEKFTTKLNNPILEIIYVSNMLGERIKDLDKGYYTIDYTDPKIKADMVLFISGWFEERYKRSNRPLTLEGIISLGEAYYLEAYNLRGNIIYAYLSSDFRNLRELIKQSKSNLKEIGEIEKMYYSS